ncbi:MAG: sporulation protein [Myxococcales bacterium]|nr:sporulation protein [Myxococcales bacterium]
MGFSDKMRETLGSEGARIEVMADEEGWAGRASPGGVAEAKIKIVGGTKLAHIEAVTLRVIIRHRHWSDGQGMSFTEQQAREFEDRRQLMPAWSRELIAQARVEVDADVDTAGERELSVQVQVPGHCDRTTVACTITLHAQADIRGQIDPTATGKLLVA